jgi:hypothetical protein
MGTTSPAGGMVSANRMAVDERPTIADSGGAVVGGNGDHDARQRRFRKVRMRLRRHDGGIFLDRWGWECDRVGGVFLHRMSAPDPGLDLHDHPWPFWSVVVVGGYTEERADARLACQLAALAEQWPDSAARGVVEHRGRWSVKAMRLDECHRVVGLDGRSCWTIVIRGPGRRRWGFYMPGGWVDEHTYEDTARSERRDLWNEAV